MINFIKSTTILIRVLANLTASEAPGKRKKPVSGYKRKEKSDSRKEVV